MDQFSERMKAYEKKYVLDAEQRFKIEARACKKLGLDLAARFGMAGADAEAYAMQVVSSNLKEAGFNDVIEKVRIDLDKAGISDLSDHAVETLLLQYMDEAAKEIASAA